MTLQLCGRRSIGMLSTSSYAGTAVLPACTATDAKLAPEPTVKPTARARAASLRMIDVFMTFLLIVQRLTMGGD